jgi:peroxiredoxin
MSLVVFAQTPSKHPTVNMDSLFQAKMKEAIGKPFPKFAVADKDGIVNNDSLMGKVVLINFWFKACHPCIAEFGALNELAEKLKGTKDFQFISFTRENAKTIKKLTEKYKLQFKALSLDDKECKRLNQNNGYPTTIILDRQGVIKYLVSGGSIDPQEARKFVMNGLLPKIQKELQEPTATR